MLNRDEMILEFIIKSLKEINQKFDEMNQEMNQKFDEMNQKFDEMNQKFDEMNQEMNQKFDYMESEIKTIKLTQNYIRETTNIGLEKPLDSISLASFLADEQEENSFFKLFR